MSVNGKFVIDSVTHAFDSRPENLLAGKYASRLVEHNFQFQWDLLPDPYRLPADRYYQAITAEALTSALFLESRTDMACYHTIPAWGVFRDLSPISVALEIREKYPQRMIVYGAASPLEGKKAFDDLRRQAEEWGIYGVKLYPIDVIDGVMRDYRMSDTKLMYPFYELCGELGVRTIAIHKAIPLGTGPMDPFIPNDIDYAARDFPDLNFEIVHGGFAFLEETASQMHRFENVYVNLEVSCQLVIKHRRLFAKLIGELLRWHGGERIFWGTGCSFTHPEPVLEAFDAFQMPPDMVDDDGYPELTDDIKADILGRNFARMHGIDIEAARERIEADELTQQRATEKVEPWSGVQ
jgi:uncharacterized protein